MKQALALILLVYGSFRAVANPTSGWDVDSYSSSSSLLGGYLMLGTVIFIMLFAIGGAIAELGNEKLKKMKKKMLPLWSKSSIQRDFQLTCECLIWRHSFLYSFTQIPLNSIL